MRSAIHENHSGFPKLVNAELTATSRIMTLTRVFLASEGKRMGRKAIGMYISLLRIRSQRNAFFLLAILLATYEAMNCMKSMTIGMPPSIPKWKSVAPTERKNSTVTGELTPARYTMHRHDPTMISLNERRRDGSVSGWS